MIPVTTFPGREVAVFGLGLSGIAAAHALAAGGARVLGWDDTEASRDNAAAQGVDLRDLASADWSGIAALVLAPGIPLTHPDPHWAAKKAQAAGIEVIGDTELFFREKEKQGSGAKVVVITGTNGKSTTTALAAHLLQSGGRPIALGGNIGRAVLDLPPSLQASFMCSNCRPFRSTSRLRLRRTPPRSSTSRRIISTGTAPSRTMPPSRPEYSTACPPTKPPSSASMTIIAAPSPTRFPVLMRSSASPSAIP
jgi:hypothetical protein